MTSRELFKLYGNDDLRKRIGPETFCQQIAKSGCIVRDGGEWRIVRPIMREDLTPANLLPYTWRYVFRSILFGDFYN